MSVRVEPTVLWHEGMFLCPQHMQAFAREIYSRVGQGNTIGSPGAYGLLALRIENEKLEHDVFSILECAVLFRDGTLARFPETGSVEQRAFASLFTGPELNVYLGVLAPRPNVPQVEYGSGRQSRYQVHIEPMFDENLRDATKDIEFRHLQGRLFFGDEDKTGFECVPIARLARRGKPEVKSVLAPDHVPPLLACGASTFLMQSLKDVAEAVRSQARDLAVRIPATAGLSSVEKGADLAGFVKLEAMNRSIPSLDQLAGLPALHPFDAYMWLTQTVGNLAVFGKDRVTPSLPVYDHERLDECFAAAFREIRALLSAEVAVPYDTVSFHKDPVREGFFECEIPREWIAAHPIFYFAMEVGEPAEEVAQLVSVGVSSSPRRTSIACCKASSLGFDWSSNALRRSHSRVGPICITSESSPRDRRANRGSTCWSRARPSC